MRRFNLSISVFYFATFFEGNAFIYYGGIKAMEKEDLIKKLETVEVPKIELQSHKSRLKVALLTFHSFSNTLNLKVRRFLMAKKFVPIGAVALVALLIAGVVFIGLNLHSKVDAREVVNKAVEAVKSENSVGFIDPVTGMIVWKGADPDGKIRDPQGNVIATTTPDGKVKPVNAEKYVFTPESFLSVLEEAREAQDLTYLGNTVLPNGEKVKIFRFTDKKGITNIVGIDKNNLPVVGFAYKIDKDSGTAFMTEIVGSSGSAEAEISISGGTTEPGDSGGLSSSLAPLIANSAKKFVPIGAVALVALLIAGVVFIGLNLHSKVDAREVVNKAVEAVKSENSVGFIDPVTGMIVWKGADPDGKIRDPQGNVIATTTPDGKVKPVNAEKYVFTPESFLSVLEEAREAQDLTYLGNTVLPNGEKVKIFRFTDKKGITNIVGIDKNNLPVVGFAYKIDKDSGTAFMTEIVGSSGSAEAEISISGGTTEPGDSGGSISDKVPSEDFIAKLQERIKYWTENLEKP
jgi:hypothetical protein